MADKSLIMGFITSKGKKASLKLEAVKDDIAEGEVKQLMDTIIAKNIFAADGGSLVQKDGAQLVEKNVSKIKVK